MGSRKAVQKDLFISQMESHKSNDQCHESFTPFWTGANGMPRMCGDIAMNESSLVNAGCIFNGQKITNKRSKKQTKNKV